MSTGSALQATNGDGREDAVQVGQEHVDLQGPTPREIQGLGPAVGGHDRVALGPQVMRDHLLGRWESGS